MNWLESSQGVLLAPVVMALVFIALGIRRLARDDLTTMHMILTSAAVAVFAVIAAVGAWRVVV